MKLPILHLFTSMRTFLRAAHSCRLHWSCPLLCLSTKMVKGSDDNRRSQYWRRSPCSWWSESVVRCLFTLVFSQCYSIHAWPYSALSLRSGKASIGTSLPLLMVCSAKVNIETLRHHQLSYWIRRIDVTCLQAILLEGDCEAVTNVQLYTFPDIYICS